MMKSLKLWQKAGLVAAIVGGLTLSGLTPNYSSKGLESKIPTITMSTAEAKETNPQGYEIPDLTGYNKKNEWYVDVSEKIDGKETLIEKFVNNNGDTVLRLSYKNYIYGYSMKDGKGTPYTLIDSQCKGIFDNLYVGSERFNIPECLK